ncbi:MAG: glycerate kinase [Actinomycetes bacterium]
MADVHIVVAPDAFSGTLTARQAAAAIATGWRAQAPADVVETCPLSDGGPGFVDALHSTLGGELLSVTVPGPLGDDAPATVLRHEDVAYVETAQACGLHLLPPERRDPTRTTTAGVGRLLTAAVDSGARRVVLGLGGSATVDGGAGLLAALGAGDPTILGRGGGLLAELPDDALPGLADVRERFAGVELVAATDVDVPLVGFHGAAAAHAERQGATPEQAQQLGTALGRFAQVALDTLGPDVAPQRLVAEPGAGAAGGLGFALLLLGARREPGAQAVLDAVGFRERLAAADLVVTGEGTLDWQSLRGTVVAGVAHAALAVGVPAVALAGQVHAGRRELQSVGLESAYAVAERPDQVPAALADPAGTLAARARRVARTWSH